MGISSAGMGTSAGVPARSNRPSVLGCGATPNSVLNGRASSPIRETVLRCRTYGGSPSLKANGSYEPSCGAGEVLQASTFVLDTN